MRCKIMVLAIPILLWLVGALVHPTAKAFVWGVLSAALIVIDAVLGVDPSFHAWLTLRF